MKTKDRLLEVAGRLFAEHGFDGVSVRDIVGAAKVNLGAVTYHFGSKEALFGAVLSAKIAPLEAIGRGVEESRDRADVKLKRALGAYAHFVLNEEPSLKALFTESLQGGSRIPARVRELLQWRTKVLGDIIRQGMREKVFRRCDVDRMATMLLGVFIPYIQEQPILDPRYRRGAYSRGEVDKIVSAAVDLVFNGLKVKGGSVE